MKKIIDFFRSFFLAPFILYIFNKMAVVIDIFIPINFFTIVIVGLLDFYGLVMLIVIFLIVF